MEFLIHLQHIYGLQHIHYLHNVLAAVATIAELSSCSRNLRLINLKYLLFRTLCEPLPTPVVVERTPSGSQK